MFNFSLKKILILCIHFLLGWLSSSSLHETLSQEWLHYLFWFSYSYGVLSYLFETHSFIASFYLDCCFHFYVSGRLVMLSDLGNLPFVGDIMCPSNTSPSHHRGAICSRGCVCLPIVLGWLCRQSNMLGLVPVQLVARPCIAWRLLAVGWWDQVWSGTRCWLIVGLGQDAGDSGAVATQWWVEPGPRASVAHWQAESDTRV